MAVSATSHPIAPTLPGPRCVLRALLPSDALAIARHADDEAVWMNLYDGFPRPYTLADAQAWCTAGCHEPENGLVWAIDVAGEAIGCIALRPEAGWLRCNAEVGYWIGRSFWKRGIASESLRRVTDWGFAAWPELTRIYAPIFAWNVGSQAVARHCGYKFEGELRRSAIKNGRVIDRVQYAAHRAEPL